MLCILGPFEMIHTYIKFIVETQESGTLLPPRLRARVGDKFVHHSAQ